MRARKQLVVTALALPLIAGVAGCDAVSDAQQTGDKAQTCLEATRIANFTPSWNDAEKAKAEAKAKADEVAKLAEKAGDETIRQHLTTLEQSLQKVADGEVPVEQAGSWVQEQYKTYEALTAACTSQG